MRKYLVCLIALLAIVLVGWAIYSGVRFLENKGLSGNSKTR